MLPVTREYFVSQISLFMIGYQKGIQLVKAGDRKGICSQKWSHLTKKLREFSNI